MRLSRLLIPLLVLGLVGGCTRLPEPESYAMTKQHKMQAAHHWNVLAGDVANQINRELIDKGYLNSPVHVRHSCGEGKDCAAVSPFDEGFNDLLTTQLVNFGVPTLTEPAEDSLVVDYKVQIVHHQAFRSQWPRTGAFSALTAGIVVLRDAPWEIIALATAAMADTARATSVVNGHYEVIISTSIVDGQRYVVRKSDIYYINDEDFWHYQQPGQAPEIELTSRQP